MTREEAINKLQYIRTHYPSKNIENIEADNALVMAIDALNFIDIDQYCKEHFCVMVDRDVWDNVTKGLVKSKAKCKDCIYLSSEKSTIGRLCINPSKKFRTKTSCWKHTTNPACKLFKAR